VHHVVDVGSRRALLKHVHPLVVVLIATTLEVSGDALVRKALDDHAGLARVGLMLHYCGRLDCQLLEGFTLTNGSGCVNH
jgi:hypothetical protein